MPLRFALLLGLIVDVSRATAQTRPALNLVTHSQVEIDQGPAAIWPRIVDPSEWKQGLKLRHHAGTVGALGEVSAAVDPANPAEPAFLVENVEFVPNVRRTIKLYLPSGALIGYASWTLEPRGARTVVHYDVYSETLVPAGDAPGLAEQQRIQYEANQQRFDAELVVLKRLVEGHR
jgi:hypothetical protein